MIKRWKAEIIYDKNGNPSPRMVEDKAGASIHYVDYWNEISAREIKITELNKEIKELKAVPDVHVHTVTSNLVNKFLEFREAFKRLGVTDFEVIIDEKQLAAFSHQMHYEYHPSYPGPMGLHFLSILGVPFRKKNRDEKRVENILNAIETLKRELK